MTTATLQKPSLSRHVIDHHQQRLTKQVLHEVASSTRGKSIVLIPLSTKKVMSLERTSKDIALVSLVSKRLRSTTVTMGTTQNVNLIKQGIARRTPSSTLTRQPEANKSFRIALPRGNMSRTGTLARILRPFLSRVLHARGQLNRRLALGSTRLIAPSRKRNNDREQRS